MYAATMTASATLYAWLYATLNLFVCQMIIIYWLIVLNIVLCSSAQNAIPFRECTVASFTYIDIDHEQKLVFDGYIWSKQQVAKKIQSKSKNLIKY